MNENLLLHTSRAEAWSEISCRSADFNQNIYREPIHKRQ